MIRPAAGVGCGCVQMVLTVFGAGTRGLAAAVAWRTAGPDGGAGNNRQGTPTTPRAGDTP